MRQMAILLSIYLEPPPHTVRGLAEKLGVTKPVITRRWTPWAHETRQPPPRSADKRNVVITRTVEGSLYLERFADVIIGKARDLPL
jgi:hypothetical protein